MTRNVLEKVTAFVTRQSPCGQELLLFRHPHAGIQLPAGTVEEGETPEQAVLREAMEETGLSNLRLGSLLGRHEQSLPENFHAVLRSTPVYSRPDRRASIGRAFRAGSGCGESELRTAMHR